MIGRIRDLARAATPVLARPPLVATLVIDVEFVQRIGLACCVRHAGTLSIRASGVGGGARGLALARNTAERLRAVIPPGIALRAPATALSGRARPGMELRVPFHMDEIVNPSASLEEAPHAAAPPP